MENETSSLAGRYLTLTLGDEYFAIGIANVREILDLTDITRIPQTPDFMLGVVNVRGSAVPVVDLRMKFGMGRVEHTLNTRIVIVEVAKNATVRTIGAMADSVKEVLELEEGQIDPPPHMGTSVRVDFIRGIGRSGGRFILILDTDKVFTTEELTDFSSLPSVLSEARPENPAAPVTPVTADSGPRE